MALGKGLDALFPQSGTETKGTLSELKLSMLEPRPDQPRKSFNQEQLQALADSIAEHGVIQPIVVVEGENGYYRIIAGERRWRAAKIAGLSTIPSVIKEFDEIKSAQISLVENLQRENLNPIEEALGYRSLVDHFGMTQEQVSEKVGKSRSVVANTLRLLALEDPIKKLLLSGALSAGHARALLAVSDKEKRLKLAQLAANGEITVRDIENASKIPPAPTPRRAAVKYPDVENSLTQKFGTKVKIKGNEKKGRIEISYYSEQDLTRLIDLL